MLHSTNCVSFLREIKKFYDGKVILIGGMAAIVHGVERSTVDVDFMFDGAKFAEMQSAIERAVFVFEPERVKVSAKKQAHPLSDDPFKNSIFIITDANGRRLVDFIGSFRKDENEALERTISVESGGFCFDVISAPHLVLMKLLANGPKDKLDVYEICRLSNESLRKEIYESVEKYGQKKQLEKVLSLFGEN